MWESFVTRCPLLSLQSVPKPADGSGPHPAAFGNIWAASVCGVGAGKGDASITLAGLHLQLGVFSLLLTYLELWEASEGAVSGDRT